MRRTAVKWFYSPGTRVSQSQRVVRGPEKSLVCKNHSKPDNTNAEQFFNIFKAQPAKKQKIARNWE